MHVIEIQSRWLLDWGSLLHNIVFQQKIHFLQTTQTNFATLFCCRICEISKSEKMVSEIEEDDTCPPDKCLHVGEDQDEVNEDELNLHHKIQCDQCKKVSYRLHV